MTESSSAPARPTSEDPHLLLARLFLKLVLTSPAPLNDRKTLEPALQDALKAAIRTRQARPGEISQTVKGGGITIASTLVYWVGFMTGHIWLPAAGLAFAILGAAGVTTGYKWICEARRQYEYLQAYLGCMLLMQQADGIVTDQEKRHVEAFVASLGLSEKERQELLTMRVKTVTDIPVPAWMELEHRQAILTGTWGLVCCDGVAPEEEALFAKLVEHFGLQPDDMRPIRTHAEQAIKAMETRVLDVGSLTAAWMDLVPADVRLIDLLQRLIQPEPTREQLEAAFLAGKKAYAAGGYGRLSAFPTPEVSLAGAYICCRGISGPAAPEKRVLERFLAGATHFGKEPEAAAFRQLIDRLFEEFQRSPTP